MNRSLILIYLNQSNMQMCDLCNQSVCMCLQNVGWQHVTFTNDLVYKWPINTFQQSLLPNHPWSVLPKKWKKKRTKTKTQSGAIRTISRHFISDTNSIFLALEITTPEIQKAFKKGTLGKFHINLNVVLYFSHPSQFHYNSKDERVGIPERLGYL